ncbi:MAG: peptidyl-prolyl cis-trans isomerase [Chromatiales bacterium]|jgi:parvulin-like peptidyl-prolyl isomerase
MRDVKRLLALAGLAYALGQPPALAGEDTDAGAPDLFARVGEQVITAEDFRIALRQGMRERFYHGRVPEAELATYQREIGDDLVRQALLEQEAERRGIEPDEDRVSREIAAYVERYGEHPQWEEHQAEVLARLERQLRGESRVARLERRVRDVGEPDPAEARAFYEANPKLFTEPERMRVAVILLKVAANAPPASWEGAQEEARDLVRRLREGAEFADLARLHSGDHTAPNGGDMGYVHRGMLAPAVQVALDDLEPGAITEPVTVLEGVAVFRLLEQQEASLNPFDAVRDRAVQLWERSEADSAWKGLIEQLRASTPVQINENHYLALPAGQAQEEAGAPEGQGS